MTPSQPLIAIIGAGPAGLTLACLLERARITYTVFERDESAAWADNHASSGTLDIRKDSGQAALREAGLLEQFQSLARHDVPVRIADATGHVCADIPGDGNSDKPEIDRKDLRRLLLASVPPARIRWGCKVEHVQRDSHGSVSVLCTDGRVESGYRLVVGADGAWSKVRKLITSSEPEYSGTHFFTTFIKPSDPTYSSAASLAENGNYLAMTKQRQTFLHYLGDASYHLSVGLKLSQDWALESGALHDASALWESLLQDAFMGWTPRLTELIHSADHGFRPWPLYFLPKASLPWARNPGVTLLGDAAHLTVPAGEGVNNALCDSVELARQIVTHGIENLDAAVAEYEKEMFPRALAACAKGEWFLEHFFGADEPQDFLQSVAGGSERE